MASNGSEHPAGAPNAAAPAAPGAGLPLIGVTTYLERSQTGVWDVMASFLPQLYINGVTDAGGIAVLLPPQPVDPAIAQRVIAGLDGLIISGGADVDPRLYGQEPHPATGAPREDRDAWELALTRAALDADLPYFGICRGAQVLNVAYGGSLVQHLPDVIGDERYQPGAAVFGEQTMTVTPGSALAGVVGHQVDGQVYHHQAIDEVGAGLSVTARSADGVIEAVEVPGRRYALAVQWHPEETVQDRRLFAGLVTAAAERKARTS